MNSKISKRTKRKNKKAFGVIGLGRMGGDLALRAIEKGWRVVGYNRSPDRTRALARKGLVAASSLAELVSELKPPRIVSRSSSCPNRRAEAYWHES